MLGAVLIFLVVVNAFVTGVLVVQLQNVKKVVATVADVQRLIASDAAADSIDTEG